MIGVYDYTVLATYLSLAFGVSGILAAMNGSPYSALLCLMVSGLLDAFDGRIARTKKNRTEQGKRFRHPDRLAQRRGLLRRAPPGVIGASLGGGEWWLRARASFSMFSPRSSALPTSTSRRRSARAPRMSTGITTLKVPVTAASLCHAAFLGAAPLRIAPALAVIYASTHHSSSFFITPLHNRASRASSA